MTSRRARVDELTDDVATLSEKVRALHEDFERALEELEEADAAADDAPTPTDGPDAEPARADGGNVGWQEIETAGPDGAQSAESVEWTPVDPE